ncbi:MarR family winged helix-turn-helix transcriptional regulator [Methylobrevis albus]|uniref:MarR family transcriptional regulator n=1 Tax=Methylobrevis albus TaxID=2793297 RepID=A0A931I2Y8_9HYPH|nr:MarR family transcriptional regulator [Methylobrevis albus]MBH0238484.1 MarR family transcriptional regulator [Methylobrevis albus]
MADINFSRSAPPVDPAAKAAEPSGPDFQLIELLFFAYRDFVGDADQMLARYGFGRAHHRVLYFVERNPGIRVTDLLDILRITKQSLGRVLKQLVDEGFILQTPGESDRRQRLLHATRKGSRLVQELAERQSQRLEQAAAGLDAAGRAGARAFLQNMIDRDAPPRAPSDDVA